MDETNEIRSPLTRPPRKPSYLVLWVFLSLIASLAVLVVAETFVGRTGASVMGSVTFALLAGIKVLRGYAETGRLKIGPESPLIPRKRDAKAGRGS